MESTRAIGYSVETAVADLIDNSIAAQASTVEVSFVPDTSSEPFVTILDNGTGMDEAALDLAMQYGSRNPNEERSETDLGRFGLGLKTASLSQCRRLTVLTRTAGGDLIGRCWDLDEVIKTGKWSLLVLSLEDMHGLPDVEKIENQTNGTLVIWQNLDRMLVGENSQEKALAKRKNSVDEHLRLVFHRYLSGEEGLTKLSIRVNGDLLKPADPFLLKSGKTTEAMAPELLQVDGRLIEIRSYILPHISKLSAAEKNELGGKDNISHLQGFYVYRAKRLVIWGTWFRMMRRAEMSKLVRVMVDIPNDLDDLWTLDIKKSQAVPPAAVRENLRVVIEKLAEKSRRTWVSRGRRELSKNKDIALMWDRKVSNDGVVYCINRGHPAVRQLCDLGNDVRKKVEGLLKAIENGIPLNQLYLDLNGNESFENEKDYTEAEIRQMLQEQLESCKSREERICMLSDFKKAEPYCSFQYIIDDMLMNLSGERP